MTATVSRQFTDMRTNTPLAVCEVPEDFLIGGMLNGQFQSDIVPFTFAIHAINNDQQITLFNMSPEMFYDYRNMLMKQTLSTLPTTITTSFRDFIEPEDYLKQVAESIFGARLDLQATADLPSRFNMNLQSSFDEFANVMNMIVMSEAQSGSEVRINNAICKSYLMKYAGVKDGKEYTILAGMDYQGAEFYFPMADLFNGIGNMFGNLFGNAAQRREVAENGAFGHNSPTDLCIWGSRNRYIGIFPKEKEDEGSELFVKFVSSYVMDQNLNSQFNGLVSQKMQQSVQQAYQYQSMARQSQANLQYQQQKLTNMISQNSQSISAGIMDSWDRKMASQARTSENFSQAIRGVDTYTTTDGRNVEVSVGADHVYENRYGDVYGVSGNSLDSEVLNKLNWTEINKK